MDDARSPLMIMLRPHSLRDAPSVSDSDCRLSKITALAAAEAS